MPDGGPQHQGPGQPLGLDPFMTQPPVIAGECTPDLNPQLAGQMAGEHQRIRLGHLG